MSVNEVTKSKSKKGPLIAGVIAIVVLLSAGIAYWYTQVKVPHQNALAQYELRVAEFSSAEGALAQRNAELEQAAQGLQELINSDKTPLDLSVLDQAATVIGEAQGALVEPASLPLTIEAAGSESLERLNTFSEEVQSFTRSMNDAPSYEEPLEKIDLATSEVSNSYAQFDQVSNPSEMFVIQRLEPIKSINGIQAATEDNDPNGQLNKQGGYTAAVYFRSNLVDKADLSSGTDIVSYGTDGGGQIEVYETVEAAEKRNTYLSAFDGGVINSGSHTVVGTLVVRTSSNLTASQQKELETQIIQALISLD